MGTSTDRAVTRDTGVTVDGVRKAPGQPVVLQSRDLKAMASVNYDRDTNVTEIVFTDQGNHRRTVAFADPIGYDEHGALVRHPLGKMADAMIDNLELDTVSLRIDRKGNVDYAIANDKFLDRGHSGHGAAVDLLPRDKRVPSPDLAFIDHLDAQVGADERAEWAKHHVPVSLDDNPQQNEAVKIEGTVVGVADRDGVKRIAFVSSQDGLRHELSFRDPSGIDGDGKPIPNPLGDVARNFKHYEGARFRLGIDAAAENYTCDVTASREGRPPARFGFGRDASQADFWKDAPPLKVPHDPKGSEPLSHAPKGVTMESLLKPTAADRDGFVQLGTPPGQLKVERAIYEDFRSAELYLGRSQEAVDVLYHLTNPKPPQVDPDDIEAEAPPLPKPIEIRKPKDFLEAFDGDEYNDRTHTIIWESRMGLENEFGHVLSPALALLHEEGHAAFDNEHGIDRSPFQEQKTKDQWTTREERRNTLGLEDRVAFELGEPRRYDHKGTPVPVASPIAHRVDAVFEDLSVEDLAKQPPQRYGVTVDRKEQPNGTSISGKIIAMDDRDGVKTVLYRDDGGNQHALAFADPVGIDKAGEPTRHPLARLEKEFYEGNKRDFTVDIDPSGRNIVASVGSQEIKAGPEVALFEKRLDAQNIGPHRTIDI